MRFRRRRDAPPESEADDSVWARPSDEAEPEALETVVPAEGSLGEPAYVFAEEPAHELVDEPAEGVAEEPAGEIAEDPVYELLEEPTYESAGEPELPVDEPVAVPADNLVEMPADELVEIPADDPFEEPGPVEAPTPPAPAPVTRWRGGREDAVPGAEGTVRAAGGVVWSRWRGGVRVAVVHRPRYDDWSLPKGKAGPGESDAECALREVREETGLACSLGEELGTATYHDRHGRLKTVVYFAMEPLGGGEGPQAEVDEVRWLGLEDAKQLLTYARDVDMLDALAASVSGWEQPGASPAG